MRDEEVRAKARKLRDLVEVVEGSDPEAPLRRMRRNLREALG